MIVKGCSCVVCSASRAAEDDDYGRPSFGEAVLIVLAWSVVAVCCVLTAWLVTHG